MSTSNEQGPGRPSEPFDISTTNSNCNFTALAVGYQLQRVAAVLEWQGHYLAKTGGPFANQGISVALAAQKFAELAADIIARSLAALPETARKLLPAQVFMPAPPARCPLGSGQYVGVCWTSSCSNWRGTMAGVVGTCACMPSGDAA